MIPAKSKAIFLVNDFTYYYKDGVFSEISIEIAKGFALICVNEILNLSPLANRKYWKEVKNEIEKQLI